MSKNHIAKGDGALTVSRINEGPILENRLLKTRPNQTYPMSDNHVRRFASCPHHSAVASPFYDIATGQSTLFRQPKVDFDGGRYETRQVFVTSKDGTPMTEPPHPSPGRWSPVR